MSEDNVSLIEKRIRLDRADDTCKDCGLVAGRFEMVEGNRSLLLSFEGLSYDIEIQDQ